jgi:hypothetical protein
VARKGFFYFHPSRPTQCGHLCRPNMLSRLSNAAHDTGRASIHLGNPGLLVSVAFGLITRRQDGRLRQPLSSTGRSAGGA